MVIKMSDYIMESCISPSDVSMDIITEQADATVEVATKMMDAYIKQYMMLEYYYQEGDESGSSFGSKVKDFFGKIIEGIKKVIGAICGWFRGIFDKIKGLFTRSEKEVVQSARQALADIPSEARNEYEVTFTREDFVKYVKSETISGDLDDFFDSVVDKLKIATRAIPVFKDSFLPAVQAAEEAIRGLTEAVETGDEEKAKRYEQDMKRAGNTMGKALERIGSGSRAYTTSSNVVRGNGSPFLNATMQKEKATAADGGNAKSTTFNPDEQKKRSKSDTITFNYEQAVELVEKADEFIGQNMQAEIDAISDRIKELEDNIKKLQAIKTYKNNPDFYKNGRFDVEAIDREIEDLEYELGKEATTKERAREIKTKLEDLKHVKANGGGRLSIREEERIDAGVSNDVIEGLNVFRETLSTASSKFREIFTGVYTFIKGLIPQFKKAADDIKKGKADKAKKAAIKMRDEERAQKRRELGIDDDGNGGFTIHKTTDDEITAGKNNSDFSGYNNKA